MISKPGLVLLLCFILTIGQSSTKDNTSSAIPTITTASATSSHSSTFTPLTQNVTSSRSDTAEPKGTDTPPPSNSPSTQIASTRLSTSITTIIKTEPTTSSNLKTWTDTSLTRKTTSPTPTATGTPTTHTTQQSIGTPLTTSKPTSTNHSPLSIESHTVPTTDSHATVNGSSPGMAEFTGTSPSAASLPPQVALRYPTVAFINTDNDTCPFGYIPEISINACKHVCEIKECQNGGQCYAEVDVDNGTVALCRCQETSNKIYKGDTCDISKLSRHRERAITLGILLPFDVLFIHIIIAMCYKLKHRGNQFHAAQKSYDVNNL